MRKQIIGETGDLTGGKIASPPGPLSIKAWRGGVELNIVVHSTFPLCLPNSLLPATCFLLLSSLSQRPNHKRQNPRKLTVMTRHSWSILFRNHQFCPSLVTRYSSHLILLTPPNPWRSLIMMWTEQEFFPVVLCWWDLRFVIDLYCGSYIAVCWEWVDHRWHVWTFYHGIGWIVSNMHLLV